jgi:uncharacterized DUF497 family protein
MTIVFRLQGVEFEWDEEKAAFNAEKHSVTFEEAAEAFFDPFYQTGDQTGDATVDQESREFIIGYTFDWRLLLVVNAERSVRTRIISARPVSRMERKIYEEA